MQKQFLDFYQTLSDCHIHALGMMAILDNTNVDTLDLDDAVDLVYVLRELTEKYKTLKTKVEKKFEQTSTQVATRMSTVGSDKVEGEYANATWDYNVSINVPSKLGKDGYVETLQSLGIPDATIALDIVRLHYPNYCAYLKENDVPANDVASKFIVDNSKIVPKLKLRKRKSLDNVE